MNPVFDARPQADTRSEFDAFREEIAQAIDGLVGGVLALQDGQVAPLTARVHSLERQAGHLLALSGEVRRISQDLEMERSCRALAEMSRWYPKERTVVFVGRWHFGDNVKYAWLAALEHAQAGAFECWYLPPDAKQESMVRSLGVNCLPCNANDWSPEHFQVAQRTAVLVVGDHFFTGNHHPNRYAPSLFAGARWLQLWHGISIKEVALRYPVHLRDMNAYHAQSIASCGRYGAFVGSSEAAEADWRRWFAFENYSAVGYPRNDVLLREPTDRDLLNVHVAVLDAARRTRAAGGRAVLYVPTFRDGQQGKWLHGAGLDTIARALEQRGDRLIVNLHPLDQPEQPALMKRYPDVLFMRDHCDIYPVLREVDLMITDYSSLMFDFLPLDRPLMFYRPDHQLYIDESRPLYDAKVSTLPGPAYETADALAAALQGDPSTLDAPFAAARAELLARLFDQVDAGASERVVDLVMSELDGALANRT